MPGLLSMGQVRKESYFAQGKNVPVPDDRTWGFLSIAMVTKNCNTCI